MTNYYKNKKSKTNKKPTTIKISLFLHIEKGLLYSNFNNSEYLKAGDPDLRATDRYQSVAS